MKTEKKASYSIIKNRINQFNNQPIAMCDSYIVKENETLDVPAESGILNNDFDIDGNSFNPGIVQGPKHGNLELSGNGSFVYDPFKKYFGNDSFTYSLYDGFGHSDTTQVFIQITPQQKGQLMVYPNPSTDQINIHTDLKTNNYRLQIVNILGNEEMTQNFTSNHETIDISSLSPGYYMLIIETRQDRISRQFIVK